MHMPTPPRRRLTAAALTTVAAATATLVGPAAADAPTRIDAEYWGVSCAYDLGGGESLYFFGDGSTDGSAGGVGAFVEDADGWIVAEGWTDQFAFGDRFSTVLDLEGRTLVFDAGLVRGETQTVDLRERGGNSWTRGTMSSTELEITPTVATFDGRAIDLAGGGCGGELTGYDVLTTEPAGTVYRDRDFDSEICDVAGLADGQVRLSGILPDVYVEVLADHGAEGVEKAQGEVRIVGGEGTLTADVVDLFTGETSTVATVDVDLDKGAQSIREVEGSDGFVERRTYTPYRATVDVTFADGRRGTATCTAWATSTHVKIAPEQAPTA